MTLPYHGAEVDIDTAAPAPSQPGQDIVPHGERGQDEFREAVDHDLTSLPSRPLTREEQQAAEHDTPRGERVYAPASERVPRAPAPGHRDMIEHTDPSTPERQAAGGSSPDGVVRTTRGQRPVRIPNGSSVREDDDTRMRWRVVGLSWTALFVCGAVATWLYLRWQRERNRPTNRLRRQAHWAAQEISERVPESPSTRVSLAAALLSTGLVLWRRLHGGSSEEHTVEETYEPRVSGWLDRWVPHQVEAQAHVRVKR